MVKIKQKISDITTTELIEFLIQFPDDRRLDDEFISLLKQEISRLNVNKRVARWRSKQRSKK